MFNLWILDGVDSVGGNKIALTRNGEGIFLDFGVNMKRKRAYEVSYRVLAIANKMFYHLYSEILPRIRGIYRSDLIELDERVAEMLANQPAAFGFLVEDASLAYTGDIRIHGPRRDLTERFLEMVRGVDYLLIEGTRIDTSTNISEENVLKRIGEYIAEKPGKFACIIVSSTDLDRVRGIIEIARRLGRTPILSPRLAYLIDKLMETGSKITLPNLKNVCIYFERRSLRGGGYDLSPRHYRRWMREVYESRLDGKKDGELRKAEEISKDQGRYVLIANSLDYVLEIAQIRPDPGSRLIVSTSEPHDEEQEISWEKFLEWVDLLRLDMRTAHSSGHADRESLIRIIEEIDPRVVIPIHTERPYEFQRLRRIGDIRCEVILPHVSRSIALK